MQTLERNEHLRSQQRTFCLLRMMLNADDINNLTEISSKVSYLPFLSGFCPQTKDSNKQNNLSVYDT